MVPNVKVVGVCDLSRTRAERLAAQVDGAAAYTDLGQMLAELKPRVVHLLTPPPAHFGPAQQVLQAGVSVFAEKPLAVRSADCLTLEALAKTRGVSLGVAHNFLFSPPYERLMADLERGRLGRLDQVDVVWNKPLPQVQAGPFGGWLFRDPRNVLFEVGPHSFAHVVHLVGQPERIDAEASDPVRLPNDLVFYRRWEAHGQVGQTAVRLRFSFINGYPEHYIHLRGSTASAVVDFELNSYVLRENERDLLDFDRFATSVRQAKEGVLQAGATLGSFVLSKAGLPFEGGPYQTSITRATRQFYSGLGGGAGDARLSPALAAGAIRLAEETTRGPRLAATPAPRPARATATTTATTTAAQPSTAGLATGTSAKGDGDGDGDGAPAKGPKPTVLVLGGTGFIGRALVKRLRREGLGVRALVRDLGGYAELLAAEGAELVKGDFADTDSVRSAMSGITHMYHLARGYGQSWNDYERLDIEPTRRLAELCLEHDAQMLYTSSIAIYSGGRATDTITEDTPPGSGNVRFDPYARSKAAIEQMLLDLHRTRALKLVIFRPGIVIGQGGSPYHWGIGAWPYPSICRLWGDGTNPLPFVLVDDCADAMVLALKAPRANGQSFNLVGEPCLTAGTYLDEFERLAGIRVRRLPVAPWKRFVQDIAKYGLKTVAGSERNRPSYDYYVGMSCRARYAPDKAKETLGWRPSADVAHIVREGIAVPVSEFVK